MNATLFFRVDDENPPNHTSIVQRIVAKRCDNSLSYPKLENVEFPKQVIIIKTITKGQRTVYGIT